MWWNSLQETNFSVNFLCDFVQEVELLDYIPGVRFVKQIVSEAMTG